MSNSGSTAALLASNAKAKIEQLDQEAAQLRATTDQMVAEQSDLQSERSGFFAKSDQLRVHGESCKSELGRAQLALEVATGTPEEGKAEAWVQQCSDTLDTSWSAFREHSRLLASREAEIEARLQYLLHCIADGNKMLTEQQARRVELEALRDRAHQEHGRETYRQALEELHALEARRDMEATRARNAETRLNEFRAKLHERFSDWPGLQAEIQIAHGYVAETQFTPVLQAHSNYLAALEEALPNLPYRAGQPDLFVDNVSLWGLLGINALQLRQLYGLLAVHTPESHYMKHHQIQSITQRREVLRTMMERLELAARHTTPTEAARVAKHLAEVAGELVEA